MILNTPVLRMKFNKLFSLQLSILASLLLQSALYSQCNLPAIHLGNDTTLCFGSSMILNANPNNIPNLQFVWNNGNTNALRSVTSSGTYSVQVSGLGPNQVINGDFEQGAVNFTTDHLPGTMGNWGLLGNAGTYAVSTSPHLVHNNFSYCQDHTPAPGVNMLIVNGSTTPNQTTWCQSVPVQANTSYQLGAWVANALNSANVPNLSFTIDGQSVGTTFAPLSIACNWQQYTLQWTATLTTNVQFCIRNLNILEDGNDFMLDDITLREICNSSDTIQVIVEPNFQVNLGPDLHVCQGENVLLDAANPGKDYLWNDLTSTQTKQVTQSGTYSVTVSSNELCAKSDTINVLFYQGPDAGPDTLATYCQTIGNINLLNLIQTADLSGSFYEVNTGLLIPSPILPANLLPPTASFYYIVPSTFCPPDTSLINLVISRQESAGLDQVAYECSNDPSTLDLNLIVSQNTQTGIWQSPTALPQFNAQSGLLTHNLLSAGSYLFHYIVNSDSPCIGDTASITIVINQSPNLAFSSDLNQGCAPLAIQFSNLSTHLDHATFSWDFGGGMTSQAQDPSLVHFTTPGCHDITLTVSNQSGCSATITQSDFICVEANPIADFTYFPLEIFADNPFVQFQNESIGGNSYLWDFGDQQTNSQFSPSHSYQQNIASNYAVQLYVQTAYGCIDSILKIIQIKEQILIFIPNAFTPDQDEFNPTFKPIISDGIDLNSYHLTIFNRWGEVIFESYDSQIGWDGYYGTALSPDGTYTWKVQFDGLSDANRFVKTGMVTLIR